MLHDCSIRWPAWPIAHAFNCAAVAVGHRMAHRRMRHQLIKMCLHRAIQPGVRQGYFAAFRCALTPVNRFANESEPDCFHSAASLLPAPITGNETRAARSGRDRLCLDVIEWLCGDPSRARLVRAEPPVAPFCDRRLRTPHLSAPSATGQSAPTGMDRGIHHSGDESIWIVTWCDPGQDQVNPGPRRCLSCGQAITECLPPGESGWFALSGCGHVRSVIIRLDRPLCSVRRRRRVVVMPGCWHRPLLRDTL